MKVHQSIDDSLRTWRAAGDIHIDRDNLINSGYGSIVIVETAGRRACSKRDDPLGLRHLFVYAEKYRSKFVIYGADNN